MSYSKLGLAEQAQTLMDQVVIELQKLGLTVSVSKNGRGI
jgi:hypothetical protein